jgi:hypothetical protein
MDPFIPIAFIAPSDAIFLKSIQYKHHSGYKSLTTTTAIHLAKLFHFADVTTQTVLPRLCKEIDIRAAGPLSRFYNFLFKEKAFFIQSARSISSVSSRHLAASLYSR